MVILGVVLMLVGFALVMPRNSVAGSAAIRKVPMGTTKIYDTPGHQDDLGDRSRRLQIVVGAVTLGAGLLAVILFA